MEKVYYDFPDSDEEATCEGKYEAVIDVVCHGEQKSDVIPTTGRQVLVVYDSQERTALEPLVLAIMRCADRTFWAIADGYTGRKPA